MYEVAKQMFTKGKSLRSIAEELGYDRKKLSQQLKADGVAVKSRGMTKGTQKYRHNTDSFKVIDTEEKAYWLGFLYADGSIYEPRGTMELSLGEKDRRHLETFRDFISPDLPIKEKKIKLDDKTYIAVRIQLVCMEIVRDLIHLKCPPAKSLILEFPTEDIVPKHLIHHFMRGYFDGDGTAIVRSDNQVVTEIIGTKEFLDEYYNHIKDTGLRFHKYQRHGEAYGLRWSGNGNYEKFSDFLYKDATIYLERKYIL